MAAKGSLRSSSVIAVNGYQRRAVNGCTTLGRFLNWLRGNLSTMVIKGRAKRYGCEPDGQANAAPV